MSSTTAMRYLAPRYWLYWLLIGILRLLIFLPYAQQVRLGRHFGRLMLRFSHKMRSSAQQNLQHCFPELTQAEQEILLKKSFESAGIGAFETALAYWASNKRLLPLIQVRGLEHIQQALTKGKGVLIVGTHFSTLQLIGRLTSFHLSLAVVYRPQKNPLLNSLAVKMVSKYYKRALARGDVRGILRCLKDNIPIWYTHDIDAGLKNSVFVPFFGVQAASITATSRLAKLSGAAVVMSNYYRREDLQGYEIEFTPPIENFPSDDVVQDTLRINQAQEAIIREHPDQYLWQYRRFKTRPPGEPRFYTQPNKK